MSERQKTKIAHDELRYICDSCGELVRAGCYEVDTYPNGFDVRCGCVVMDSCPYEMSQAETPDSWHIQRPECCRGVDDNNEFEDVYGGDIADYRCPTCEWEYRWDGTFVRRPDESDVEPDDEQQRLLTDGGQSESGTAHSVGGLERFDQLVSGLEMVAFNREFGIVHDPDTECGSDRPTLAPETLDDDERWLCRRCFGYPGTAEELDAVLRENSDSGLPDGPGTLAGWTA